MKSLRIRGMLGRTRAREAFRFSRRAGSGMYIVRVTWEDGRGWIARGDTEDDAAFHLFAKDRRARRTLRLRPAVATL